MCYWIEFTQSCLFVVLGNVSFTLVSFVGSHAVSWDHVERGSRCRACRACRQRDQVGLVWLIARQAAWRCRHARAQRAASAARSLSEQSRLACVSLRVRARRCHVWPRPTGGSGVPGYPPPLVTRQHFPHRVHWEVGANACPQAEAGLMPPGRVGPQVTSRAAPLGLPRNPFKQPPLVCYPLSSGRHVFLIPLVTSPASPAHLCSVCLGCHGEL